VSNNVLGHIGYLFVVAGMLLLASEISLGWAPRLVGEVLWIIVGLRMRMNSISAWGALFVLIDIYGLWRALT
jgi:hypothetical protein